MMKYLVLAAVLPWHHGLRRYLGQRAVTGRRIGAVGAIIGALTPPASCRGALVGGAVGAGVGVATTSRHY